MPALETACRFQKAAFWAESGFDNDGNHKVNAAIELDVRWETSNKEVIDTNGNSIILEAEVVVDQVIGVGGLLRLGPLAGIPDPPGNLMRVDMFSDTPDIKNRNNRRVLGLRSFGDSLPTVNS